MDTAFFTDSENVRWYRTRDLVCVGKESDLIHRGRRDRVVKKRGHRVELAEIEACLSAHSGVSEAAVIATDAESGMVVKAFVVPGRDTRPSILELKSHCARTLPLYMVPDVFAFPSQLPRTPNGKVDLARLQAGG